MIKVKSFVFNPFLENTYVLHDDSNECIIIDPGCYERFEEDQLVQYLYEHNLKPVRLLNTHCHIDHVFGNQFVKTKYHLDLEIHQKDQETLRAVKAYAPSYGFQHFQEAEADKFFDEGDVITFGNSILNIMYVPGHAPGHVAFYNEDQKICMGGDVLFRESIGRTDLPGGDFDTLIASIRDKMFKLHDDTVVYNGHGQTTTIGHEKVYNPFCAIGR